ncbi:D-alanyl-D-alanine carboxypeptidase/D-alanyl-D-alanine-endopeptidase [Cylindrospermopsis raciborskii]|uniref:D-alanyl-D-alanine carboxypeptidase/D-alanyl-D-alanine endopeptidase n=1 Tax=Cylindrospermopsis raciborskii TaxID=77022 RepID=UPI0038D039F4
MKKKQKRFQHTGIPIATYIILIIIIISISTLIKPPIVVGQTPKLDAEDEVNHTCAYQIPSSIEKIINSPTFERMRWGILIKNLSSDQILYSRDAQKYFIPASTTKILTTAAAWQKLGKDFRIRTSIYQGDEGNFYLVGRGDPSFNNAQLTVLAQKLQQRGIRSIDKLIVDDSYFQGEYIDSSWQWEDIQADYGAPVNSLMVNENTGVLTLSPTKIGENLNITWSDDIELYSGIENNSITVAENEPRFFQVTRDLKGQVLKIDGKLPINSPSQTIGLSVIDPIDNFLKNLRLTWAKVGITVKEIEPIFEYQHYKIAEQKPEIAVVESLTLPDLVKEANMNSNNLYAEALLRHLSNRESINKQTNKRETTVNQGLKILKTTLSELEIEPNTYMIVDGSGLSRKNLISPEALVKTLQVMAKSPDGNLFRASLATGGMTGTLKNRFLKTPAWGIVQGKTGSMTGVISLSGYINVPNYDDLVFSMIVNQSQQPSAVRKAMDEIIILLVKLHKC